MFKKGSTLRFVLDVTLSLFLAFCSFVMIAYGVNGLSDNFDDFYKLKQQKQFSECLLKIKDKPFCQKEIFRKTGIAFE
jgi:hypothetical protein